MSRRAKTVIGSVLALLALALLGAALYLESAQFQRFVRAQIVRQLEYTTGGRVEMRGFRFSVRTLEAELQGLVVRGRETDPQRPLFSAETVFVRLKVVSLLRREIDWRLLRITRPHISVTVDAAGRSNVPAPATGRAGGKSPWDKMWDLALKRLEVIEGELAWNDRRVPMDFTADNLSAELGYEPARDVYTGRLSLATEVPFWGAPGPAGAGRRASGGQQLTLRSQVRAEVAVGRGSLEIIKLNAVSARSALEAGGRFSNFSQPKLTLNYKARLELDEVAPLVSFRALHGGQAHLAGVFSYDAADRALASSGDLRLERAGVRLAPFELSGIYGTSRFRATGKALEFPGFRMSLLGGKVEGNAMVKNLEATPEVSVSARGAGFSVPALTRTFSTADLPFSELDWAGSVRGQAQLRFRLASEGEGVHNLEIEAALVVEPPSVATPGLTPVSGRGDVVYSQAADRLELRSVALETPASSIFAGGALPGSRRQAELKLVASTTDFREWKAFAAALRPGKGPVPLELQGRAEFRGVVRGTWSALSLEGHVEAVDFRYNGTEWSRFRGELACSRDLLRLTEAELRRNASSARVNLTAHLDGGELTEASPFSLQAAVEDAPLSDLQSLAGTTYPLTGQVNGSLRATGTWLNPQGSGTVTITGGALAGEPLDSLRADLSFAQGELRAHEILIRKGSAQVTGEADYRPKDKSYRFQLAGERVPLGEIARLRAGHLALAGTASFRASGEGTVERPSVNATVGISGLTVNDERVGDLQAVVETRDSQLSVRLESQFLQGNVNGNLSAELSGDFPAKGRFAFSGVDLDPLFAQGLRGRITTHSTATGFLDLSGPLKKPQALALSAEVRNFHISVEQMDLHNAGPLRASYRNRQVQIEQAHFTGEQTNLRVSGSIELPEMPAPGTLHLRADGEVNLALVRTLNPDLTGSGQLVLNATATGTFQRPLLIGRAEFRNGAIAPVDFPTGLSEMQGSVVFDTNRVWIEKLTALTGGGRVNLSGFIDDYAGRTPAVRLQGEAQGVRLRYPEGTSSVLNATLRLTGSPQNSLLSGDVVVIRGRFEARFDLARALGLARVTPVAAVTNPLLNNLHLDVRINSSPDLRFEFSQARNLQMEAALRLRGTVARPSLLGRINLLQGEIYFAGAQYVINRGDISFVNPFRIEPVVNLSLQTRAQQYEISIDLNGPLDRLNLAYRSDPPLPSGEIQALLITGRAREGSLSTQSSQTLPTIGANTILAQALNAAVGNRIERIFGVSRLKIDPQVGGPETNPGARVTLEQQVTPDVRFTYITNLASSQQQVVEVEWTINPRWSVIAVRDRNGLFGIDLRWRKRFR